MNFQRLATIFLIFTILLHPMGVNGESTAQNSNREWTIMTFISADNANEHDALLALQELEYGMSTSSAIDAVALVDRNAKYDSANGDWSGGRYYHVQPGKNMQEIESEMMRDLGEINLGNPDTLREFVQWAQSEYPAEHYALTYIGHGSELGGISWDEENGHDNLSLDEIQEAMDGLEIDIFAFDSCRVGQMEVAYEFRHFTDYIVFSQQYAVMDGFDYSNIISDLNVNPAISAEDFAINIAKSAMHNWELDVTRSVISTQYLDELAIGLSDLGDNLTAIMGANASVLSELRLQMHQLDTFIVDIGSLIDILALNFSSQPEMLKAIENVDFYYNASVVSMFNDVYAQKNSGMNLFFPVDKEKVGYYAEYVYPSGEIDFSQIDFISDTNWDQFVRSYLDNASIVEVPAIEFAQPYHLNTSYNINQEHDTNTVHYFNTTETGIYEFQMDVESGDPAAFVTSADGSPVGNFGFLFSNLLNPQYDYEQIVHKLDPDNYIVEVSCSNLTGNCTGSLEINTIDAIAMEVNSTYGETFVPRRGWGMNPQTKTSYYDISLPKGVYTIDLDVTDFTLIDFALHDSYHSVQSFRGNEGEDYFAYLEVDSADNYELILYPHAWSGGYNLTISSFSTPQLEIFSPEGIEYQGSVYLNYTHSPGETKVYVDGEFISYAYSGYTLEGLEGGKHNLTITLTDVLGNQVRKSVEFTVLGTSETDSTPMVVLPGIVAISLIVLSKKRQIKHY